VSPPTQQDLVTGAVSAAAAAAPGGTSLTYPVAAPPTHPPPQVIQDQPWTAARRRTAVVRFLTAKLQAASEQMQLEGAKGMLELAINREHHGEVDHACLAALVARMCSPNVEVRAAAAAAGWPGGVKGGAAAGAGGGAGGGVGAAAAARGQQGRAVRVAVRKRAAGLRMAGVKEQQQKVLTAAAAAAAAAAGGKRCVSSNQQQGLCARLAAGLLPRTRRQASPRG
jgi:hypothetical protein